MEELGGMKDYVEMGGKAGEIRTLTFKSYCY